MENIDIAKKIKAARPGTFGNTPQASAPKGPVPKKAIPVPVKKAQPKVEVTESKDVATVAPKAVMENKSQIVKGFSIGITKENKLTLEFNGEKPNYLELVALFEYTNVRKQEILEQMASTGSVATRAYITQLTQTVNKLAQGLGGLLEEFNKLNDKVDVLHETFIPSEDPVEQED